MAVPLCKALLVVMVFGVRAASFVVFVHDGVECICLSGTDSDGAGLKDRAVHVDTGGIFFAGLGVVVGACATIGIAAVDEGFACQCVK